jgi:hypothetical protein
MHEVCSMLRPGPFYTLHSLLHMHLQQVDPDSRSDLL